MENTTNTIKIEFTIEELQNNVGLIDAGLRATGLRSAGIAYRLATKMQTALDDYNKITDLKVEKAL